ncbi:MAG: hypothetical protein ACM3S2_09775 [Ignavibacteriales bacterium]
MELFWLFVVWVFVLYLVRIHMELFAYRKYFSQHNNIYVPSYKEIIKMDHWSLRLVQFIFSQFRKSDKKVTESLSPVYRKKLIPMS